MNTNRNMKKSGARGPEPIASILERFVRCERATYLMVGLNTVLCFAGTIKIIDMLGWWAALAIIPASFGLVAPVACVSLGREKALRIMQDDDSAN